MSGIPNGVVRYEEGDDIAIITLNRPERLNTLTEEAFSRSEFRASIIRRHPRHSCDSNRTALHRPSPGPPSPIFRGVCGFSQMAPLAQFAPPVPTF